MNLDDVLVGVTTAFLDSVVIVYFLEAHPTYAGLTQDIFNRIDDGRLQGVTSPITLAECLVVPQRRGDTAMIARFSDLITAGRGVQFVRTDEIIAKQSAVLRARYSLRLPDALQLATAIVAGCDVFLTNDARLMRVSEIRVIVLDRLAVQR